MDCEERPPVFPYHAVWEEYGPPEFVQWEHLEQNAAVYISLLAFDSNVAEIPKVTHAALNGLIEKTLGRPDPILASKLQWLAGWHIEGLFRPRIGSDLASQRRALKRLQAATEEFRDAALGLSPHVLTALTLVHSDEPDRLLPVDCCLNVSYLSTVSHDVSLAAARMLDDTKPKRTGRPPQMRRDIAVRLAAEVIEAETAEPITTSRGTMVNPAPHFTNGGGRMLRDFFKLIEPKLHEHLIVQSLERVRKRAQVQGNSR